MSFSSNPAVAHPQTALLVVDMQRVFEPMTATALPNIEKLVAHFQAASAPALFTQHSHSQEESTTVPSPNQLVRKWNPDGSIAYGSDDWKLQDAMVECLHSKKHCPPPRLVHKNTYDAFINTDLALILEEMGTRRTVVCGVMTDCCCDTTAKSAFNRGFETWLVSDACGSANEAQHQAGLKGFGYAFGDVLTTEEALKELRARGF
ncbi:unnamed protein product [Discula destructiva]